MKLLECFDKRNLTRIRGDIPKDNFYLVKGSQSRTRHGYKRTYFVKGSLTDNEWCPAFLSYDKLGLVFKPKNSNRWRFTGVISKTAQVYSRKLHFYHGGCWNRFEFNLQCGIRKEKMVKDDLKKMFDDSFNVWLMPRSGAHCHGSDIVINLHDDSEFTRFHLMGDNRFTYVVCSSLCAFEVMGLTYRGKNKDIPCFNSANKDFLTYMNELNKNDVLPFIAWIIKGRAFYMPLTPETVDAVFFTNRGNIHRQRTNYAPVGNADPFKMDRNALYRYVMDKKAF